MKGKRLPLAITVVIVLAAAAFVLAQSQWNAAPSESLAGTERQSSPAQGGAPPQSGAPAPSGASAQASAPGQSAPAQGGGSAQPSVPTQANSPAQSAAATQAQESGPASAAAVLDVVSAQSKARYRVREQLANVSLPIDAVGETPGVTGRVAFGADGGVLPGASQITVDLRQLRSDQRMRDNYVSTNTLQTNRYPTAQFVPAQVTGLPFPLPESGQAEITIAGDLTIRGVTRPVEWTGTAFFQPEGMRVEAKTSFTFDRFQIAKPRAALVLSVADEIRLETEIFFARS